MRFLIKCTLFSFVFVIIGCASTNESFSPIVIEGRLLMESDKSVAPGFVVILRRLHKECLLCKGKFVESKRVLSNEYGEFSFLLNDGGEYDINIRSKNIKENNIRGGRLLGKIDMGDEIEIIVYVRDLNNIK